MLSERECQVIAEQLGRVVPIDEPRVAVSGNRDGDGACRPRRRSRRGWARANARRSARRQVVAGRSVWRTWGLRSSGAGEVVL